MKRKLLFAIAALLCSVGMWAQTDVTADYLANPSFDSYSAITVTYADESTATYNNPTGWTTLRNNTVQTGTNGDIVYASSVLKEDFPLSGATGTRVCKYQSWNWSNNSDPNGIRQVISNLPAGTYKLTAVLGALNGWTTTLKVTDASSTSTTDYHTAEADYTGVTHTVTFTIASQQNVSITAYVTDGNNDWKECFMRAADFKLYRMPEDVTTTYISNPSFEANGATVAETQSSSAISNWTYSYSKSDKSVVSVWDNSNNATGYGKEVTPADGTYYGQIRIRWENGINSGTLTQTSSSDLPAGIYKLSIKYKAASSNNTSGTKITWTVKQGSTTLGSANGTVQLSVTRDNTQTVFDDEHAWQTMEVEFELTEAAPITYALTYAANQNSDAIFDDVKLIKVPYVDPASITLNETSLDLTTGETATLVSTIAPSDVNRNSAITWESDNKAVATVSNGVVTAIGPGSATITVTTENSVSQTCTVTVADAAAPAYYSSTIEDGTDYYIYNAATGKFLGGANDWGTRAGLIDHGIPFTVAKISDGVYTLDSHVYGNASNHFLGIADTDKAYVDAPTVNLTISAVSDGKFSILMNDKYLTANATNTVVNRTADDASSTLAQWYFVSKANRDALLASATDASPVEATYYIPNASFSRNMNTSYNTNKWSVTASNSNLASSANCAESYHSTFTVTQTISVPNGKYSFRAQGFHTGSRSPYFFIGEEATIPFPMRTGSEGSMDAAGASFRAGKYFTDYVTVDVIDGSVTLGCKLESGTDDWCIWDNFELRYHGPNIAAEATEIPMDTEMAMTADSWYYFDILVAGLYNLTTTTLSDIVYTNDGAILIENESDVTATFSQAVNATLSAGRYYIKSSSAQNFELSVGAYAYEVGAATLSATDDSYTQSSTFTVTFPDAATSDPGATAALVAESKGTVNGAEVTLSAVTKGFSVDLGSLTESTDYVISIPANVYGYAGESMNSAISVTLHTPAIFDGEYYFYDAANNTFFGRGGAYGTEAVEDNYGVPFNLTTNAAGTSNVKFVDNDAYLFIASNGVFTDGGTFAWTITPAAGGYKLSGIYEAATKYLTHASGSFGEYVTTTATEGEATVWTLKNQSERDAIIAEYPTDNINNVITASGISTTAGDFATYLSSNFNSEDKTSEIGTATFAGAVGDWTWTSSWRNQDGQPKYGTNFVEAWNATGAWTQTVDKANLPAGIYKVTVQGYERRKANDAATALYAAGYNLVSTFLSANGEQVRFTDWNEVDGKPTDTGGAVTAFAADEAVNTVYVYLDGNTDLNLTVRKPNYIWDCWLIMNNFTLTRYYQTEANMTITDAKWATFVAPFDVEIPTGVTAYTVDDVASNGSTLKMTEVTSGPIERNTPVVLYSESTVNETFYGKTVDGTPTEGLLTGVYERTAVPNGSYVLQNNGGKVGFYLVDTSVATPYVNANRAYLTAPTLVKLNAFFFGDDTATAIQGVFDSAAAGEVYDVAGRKLGKLQKGVNIVNGKKVLVK